MGIEDLPGIVLCKLLPAAPFGPLEGRQLMAAPALLAEALQLPGSQELLLLDVHLAYVAPLVVRAQMAQLSFTPLHLADWCRLSLRARLLDLLLAEKIRHRSEVSEDLAFGLESRSSFKMLKCGDMYC